MVTERTRNVYRKLKLEYHKKIAELDKLVHSYRFFLQKRSVRGPVATYSVSTEKKEVLEHCVALAQICLHIYQSNRISN